jgi:hypothetical protein
VPKLRLSSLPPFDWVQRVVSYLVWGLYFVGFLFWELTGLLPFTPWRTLSETAWDLEAKHPDIRRKLSGFLIGLAVHIRYRDDLTSSYAWGLDAIDMLDKATGQ